MKTGKVVIFCGPSGSGKGTVEKGFINDVEFNLNFSVSATTRKKRKKEIDGKHYHFLTVEEFKDLIVNDEFIEYAIFSGNYYGTLVKDFNKILNEGKNIFCEIDLQGVKNIIKKISNFILIFILPPSIEELKKRLKKRNTESEESFEARVKAAKKEIEEINNLKIENSTIIVNEDIKKSIDKVKKILRKELI